VAEAWDTEHNIHVKFKFKFKFNFNFNIHTNITGVFGPPPYTTPTPLHLHIDALVGPSLYPFPLTCVSLSALNAARLPAGVGGLGGGGWLCSFPSLPLPMV
jgi:hypothetical protein